MKHHLGAQRRSTLAERLRQQAREACERAGIQVLHDGATYRLYGRGVDMKVTDLMFVAEHDLMPAWRQALAPSHFKQAKAKP